MVNVLAMSVVDRVPIRSRKDHKVVVYAVKHAFIE